jgi:hypothetical protein
VVVAGRGPGPGAVVVYVVTGLVAAPLGHLSGRYLQCLSCDPYKNYLDTGLL